MLGLWYRSPNSGRVPRDPKNSLFITNKQTKDTSYWCFQKIYCCFNDLITSKITNKHRRKTQEAESHGMVFKKFGKVYKSK